MHLPRQRVRPRRGPSLQGDHRLRQNRQNLAKQGALRELIGVGGVRGERGGVGGGAPLARAGQDRGDSPARVFLGRLGGGGAQHRPYRGTHQAAGDGPGEEDRQAQEGEQCRQGQGEGAAVDGGGEGEEFEKQCLATAPQEDGGEARPNGQAAL
jgi:hypothetical protein